MSYDLMQEILGQELILIVVGACFMESRACAFVPSIVTVKSSSLTEVAHILGDATNVEQSEGSEPQRKPNLPRLHSKALPTSIQQCAPVAP